MHVAISAPPRTWRVIERADAGRRTVNFTTVATCFSRESAESVTRDRNAGRLPFHAYASQECDGPDRYPWRAFGMPD
jgi:hypothetical protein